MKNLWFILLVFFLASILNIIDLKNCVAVDGFVAYRSNTGTNILNSPKIRYWNNTANSGNGSWSNEIELPTTGSPIRYLKMKQSTISSKIVLVTLSDDGNLSGYVCMKYCDNASNWNLTTKIGMVWLASTPAAQRRFDISYETTAGDLLLVYGVYDTNISHDVAYKVLPDNATSFNGLTENYLNDAGHATDIQYSWVAMDRDPVNISNEIIMIALDSTDSDVNTWVWNGTNFGTMDALAESATIIANREGIAVAYAADGSKGMVASGNFTDGSMCSAYWNGVSWTHLATLDIDPSDGNDIGWLTMKADLQSADLQLTVVDSGSDLATFYWNGSSWALTTNIDTGLDSNAARSADFAWLSTGSTGRLIWETDGAGTTINQTVCSPQCNNVVKQTVSTYAGTGAWMSLFTNPTVSEVVKFLGFRLNNAFDIGAFRYNGTARNYTNYGDTAITAATTVSTYEAYSFDYRRDTRPPGIKINTPNAGGLLWMNGTFIINITTNEYVPYVTLELNSVNYSVNGSDMNWYNSTSFGEGFYKYKIYTVDWAGNKNNAQQFNLTIDYPPNVTLIDPQNNTLNTTSRNITFYYNVTFGYSNLTVCSLIIDNSRVVNVTGPIAENVTQNFSYILTNNPHNWSVWCNDSNNITFTSEVRNITVKIIPVINLLMLDDGLAPDGEIILNAGSTRFVNCSVTATDPEGLDDLINATGTFYYYQNKTTDSDNNNVHYTNNSCQLIANTSINKTFTCGFNVLYYANNGTWNCNVSVTNNYSISSSSNISNLVQSLYAVNVTDGIDFANAQSGFFSNNIIVNITNFGNMPVNVTIQGYALVIGDNVGMNCSDNKNITITNIKFSTNAADNFTQKTQMTGSIQSLNLKIAKQNSITMITNATYWQITPDPGIVNRFCSGYVIFNAEAS